MLSHAPKLCWTLLACAACSNSDAQEPSDKSDESAQEASAELNTDPTTESVAEKTEKAAAPELAQNQESANAAPDSIPGAQPAATASDEDSARVYAKTRNVWIRGEPDSRSQWIGFLWFGGSVKLKSTKPRAGWGCQEWYAVQPRGYVCVEGKRATLDPSDPVFQGIEPYSPKTDSAWPHPKYGESLGAQRYSQLPSEKLQRAREWDYRQRMEYIAQARAGGERHESLSEVNLDTSEGKPVLLPELPKTLQIDRDWLRPRSTLGWTAQVEHEGRSWLLTSDLTWVPKDRVKPYAPVEFQGVHLDDRNKLPLAFFRKTDRPRYKKTESGDFVETGETFPRLSWIGLNGEKRREQDRVFLETVTPGVYVLEDDAVLPQLREQTPWGEPLVGNDQTDESSAGSPSDAAPDSKTKGRQTWIDTSILGGWLIAYEGRKPVFTTMIAPGRGGPPQGKIPTLKTASTPTGNFKITGKFATSNMVAPGDLVHGDVPWAQNFSGPYALHAAYWHNDWGELKSGGCINVSPLDGKFLYEFSEPAVPPGWFGVRWLPKHEAATTLLVQR